MQRTAPADDRNSWFESCGRTSYIPAVSAARVLRCCIARRRECLLAAFRLIYDTYLLAGLVPPNRMGLRILPQQLLETSWILLAKCDRDIIGTLSVVEDGELGLPCESIYPEELARLRRQATHLAELTCLANRQVAGTQRAPLRLLLRSAIQLAVWRKVDCLTVCVHPRHLRFYERRLGFTELGPLRRYPRVRNQPAVAMCRSLDLTNHAAAIEDGGRRGSFSGLLGPASRACREYFWHLLDETSPNSQPYIRRLAA
jgi:hypothetical protein